MNFARRDSTRDSGRNSRRVSAIPNVTLPSDDDEEDPSPSPPIDRRISQVERASSMRSIIRRGSLADSAMRQVIQEVKKERPPTEVDTTDTTASLFPMLFSLERQVDDLLLQEVYSLIKGAATITATPFGSWVSIPHVNSVFNLGSYRPELVGGMLYGDGEFLFEELPFVLAKEKQVRCRLEVSDEDREALAMDDTTFETSHRTTIGGAARRGGMRVYFQLHEYESVTDDWIVQSLQLVGKKGPYDHIFTRAFTPKDYSAEGGAEHGGKVLRNAVHGEEKLRVLKPWLYQWCVARDPKDLGAAAMTVRAILNYYKHTFSVVRMVRKLMSSIRKVQKFTRKVLRRKQKALERMLINWAKLEQEKQHMLKRYVPANDDAVDSIVHETLLKHGNSSLEDKLAIIRQKWDARKRHYTTGVRMAAGALMPGFSFNWYIEPEELLQAWQAIIVERLSNGTMSIFRNPTIQELQRDIPKELLQMPRGTVRKPRSTSKHTHRRLSPSEASRRHHTNTVQ